MEFTADDIKQFQGLYVKYFNMKITDEMARVKLMMLVRQMEIAYQPITQEQFDKLNNEDGNVQNEQIRSASHR